MIVLDDARVVAVFAPSPIMTVTVEGQGDGSSEVHVHAGGQGVWTARMIRELGGRPVLCAALGGETGVVLRSLIDREGLGLRDVPCEVGNGAYVHDRREGQRSVVAETHAGLLRRHELDALYGMTLVAAIDAKTCVLTGVVPSVVPADVYRRLTVDLQRNGVDVLVDTSGDRLAAAVRGAAGLVKLSDEELVRDGYAVGTTIGELWQGVDELRDQGAKEVVVSRAGKPALAYLDGQPLEAAYPKVEVIEARGAGDAMTAGLAIGRAYGLSPEDALRLAVAAATLSVTRRGLATGRREDIEEIAAQVSVQPAATGLP